MHASPTQINLYFSGMKNFYNLIASLLKMNESTHLMTQQQLDWLINP